MVAPTPCTGKSQGPQEEPRVRDQRPRPAAVVVEAVGHASYSKHFITLDSQGQQDALLNRRRGIAEYLLPPIGGEANNSPSPVRIH